MNDSVSTAAGGSSSSLHPLPFGDKGVHFPGRAKVAASIRWVFMGLVLKGGGTYSSSLYFLSFPDCSFASDPLTRIRSFLGGILLLLSHLL